MICFIGFFFANTGTLLIRFISKCNMLQQVHGRDAAAVNIKIKGRGAPA